MRPAAMYNMRIGVRRTSAHLFYRETRLHAAKLENRQRYDYARLVCVQTCIFYFHACVTPKCVRPDLQLAVAAAPAGWFVCARVVPRGAESGICRLGFKIKHVAALDSHHIRRHCKP